MNKKNRYVKHTNKDRIDSLELFWMFYCCGIGPDTPKKLWARHKDGFLTLWKSLYPGTRPRLFWTMEHPESFKRLYIEEGGISELIEAKAELIRLGELDPDEYEAEPLPACYRDLKAAYFDE